MSDHEAHDVKKDVKKYLIICVALMVGTVVTVLANYIKFDTMTATIAVALFIATIKAFLVAGYFMHLMSERKMIYAILAATAFFFVGLMYLVVWARDQMPHGTAYWGNPAKPSEPAAKTGH